MSFRYAPLLLGLFALSAQAGAGRQTSPERPPIAPEPPGYALRAVLDRVVVLAKPGDVNQPALEELGSILRETAGRVRDVLGAERAPDVQLVVILDGSGVASAGVPARVPHADRQGLVFLYRYSDEPGDYLSSAAHEMVHAYRRAAGTRYSGFPEEGLAQAIALQVAAERSRFPRYGYSIPVAAGHLVASGRHVSLADVRRNTPAIRGCLIEAYLLRESFFAFLSQRYSLGVLIDFVYRGSTSLPSSWNRSFQSSFADLEKEWRTQLTEAYLGTPNHEALANRYRSESPARYQPFCSG